MDVEDIEIQLFVRAMQLRHGYDFSDYAPASLKRRIQQLVRTHDAGTISGLTTRLLHDQDFLRKAVEGLSVPVSEMFRDPPVFRALRDKVFPVLASYAEINIWQAGCAHGQEVYSLAIMLEEAGLYDRTRIYATDFNDAALAAAAEGIYATRDARDWSRNYLEAGGKHSFSDYYSARYEFIKLDRRLRRHVTFINHNLVTDKVFCEAHLILCRNVLIYFSNALQDRTLGLFRDSLVRGGFLCLGTRENIDFSPAAAGFTDIDQAMRIYQAGGSGARPLAR
ncbi:chemotaxis protein methyltransferase CheR [Luteibacter jiangsuensis]|uniref:Chemotaxis protein methyltransferase CheR n=1 Tax=Luteibacter jiangsuensis TaxID=637577 RepID=A0ABT9T2E2_9GAMM|nr:CheR family methyltransferase [Luteibacter jiangsuensis]MDQ0011444.1 chemotaxis protein methyltransferase CheR [Luteibacter jiangsuensis]